MLFLVSSTCYLFWHLLFVRLSSMLHL